MGWGLQGPQGVPGWLGLGLGGGGAWAWRYGTGLGVVGQSGGLTAPPPPPGVHTLLRKLQFLLELPARLTRCVELEAYSTAVRYHGRARAVLHHYRHLPSFHGIQADCQVIMAGLAQRLRQRFR